MAPGQAIERGAPVCCGAVEDFIRERHLNAHRRKVAESRTKIQNKWTGREEERVQASRRNVKREQVQDDRFAEIERENCRLLVRMHQIERRGPAKAAAQLALAGPAPSRGAGSTRSSSVPAGSHTTARERELRRIDAENQRLLKRLQGAKSSVNLAKYDNDYSRQQKVMRMRLEHPNDVARQEAKAANMALKERFVSVPMMDPMDEEFARLLQLKQHLQGQADAGSETNEEDVPTLRPNDFGDVDEEASRPASSSSGAGTPGGGRRAAGRAPASPARTYDAGVMPAHSRAIVEELMAYHAQEAKHYEDAEEEADAAKAAAEEAFRAAVAIDVASTDYSRRAEEVPMGYRAFIQRASDY